MVTGTNKREFSNSIFNSAESYNHHLSIETGDDFLCCAVHHAKSGELMAVDIEKPDYMDQVFQSVSCTVVNPYFTLVPDAIFDKNAAAGYLALNTELKNSLTVHSHLIPSVNAWCVYGVDKEFETKLEKKYPSVLNRHASAMTIEPMMAKIPAKGKIAVLNVFKGIFVQLIFSDGKLVFCNMFTYKVHEDIAYYLNFAAAQHKIEPGDLKVALTGPFSNEIMAGFLKKFFVVEPVAGGSDFEHHNNRFYTLIQQFSCV